MVQELRLAPRLKPDLHLKALEFFENYTFRPPTEREKDDLRRIGYDIFIRTEARGFPKILVANREYFRSNQLGFLNTRPDLAKSIPSSMVVGLKSEELFLRNSFNKSQVQLLEMHIKESKVVQELVPDGINIMLPVAVIVQLDQEYSEITGKLLLANEYARALDVTAITRAVYINPKDGTFIKETECVYAADVGRNRPEFKLDVGEWPRGGSRTNLGSLSAVVFINEIINPLAL